MSATNLAAMIATALVLATVQPSAAGITAGVAQESCGWYLPTPSAWCAPFGPAPAIGSGAREQAGPVSLGPIGGLGRRDVPSADGWSGALSAPLCSAGECIPLLRGAPQAMTGGVVLGSLSPLLLGCLTLLGALGIRPRA